MRNMQGSTLPKAYSQALKGLLALVIVGTHVSASLMPTEATPLWLRLSSALTPLALALFFFFSGYGLMLQLQVKEERSPEATAEERWRGWLPRRLSALLKPFLFFFVLSLGMEYVAQGLDTFSWTGLADKLGRFVLLWSRGRPTYPPTAWFLVELLILYLFFFVSFRWLEDRRKGLLLLVLLICGLIWLVGELNFPTYWRRYPLVFALGAGYAYGEARIYALLTRWLPAVLLGGLLLGWWYVDGLVLLTSLAPPSWGQVITFALATNLLPLLCVILGKRFGVVDCFQRYATSLPARALLLLGDISLEIYLLHISFVYLFRGPVIFIHSPWGFMLVVYASTLLGAYLLMRYASRLIRA